MFIYIRKTNEKMSKSKNKKIIEDNAPFAETDMEEHNHIIVAQLLRLFQIYGKENIIYEFKYIVGNG